MRHFIAAMACAGLLVWTSVAQEPPKASSSAKSTTVIGCLSGPDADDLYTLTSMQHRTGVMVVGGEELKQGAGAKVKLTGAWESPPGSAAAKRDAGQRFRATEITVVEAKCQAPTPVTPVSK